ncbi:MAG: hypothetical protein ACKOYN_02440, partial [Planctomycetota bacterium]
MSDFFTSQDNARRQTGRLVALFIVGVVGTIAAIWIVAVIATALANQRNGGPDWAGAFGNM